MKVKILQTALLFLFSTALIAQDFTFTATDLPCARYDYEFTPNVSTAFDSLMWDFDDGNTLVVRNTNSVTHAFAQAGIYSVRLVVYSGGSSTNVSHDVSVFDKPNLKLTYEAPSLVCAGDDLVYITVDSTNIEHSSLEFTVDWGDGTTEKYTKTDLGSKKSHQYKETSCGNVLTIGEQEITDKFLIMLTATNICSQLPVFLTTRLVDIKSKPNVLFEIDQSSNVNYDTLSNTYYICGEGNIKLLNKAYGTDNCLNVDDVSWRLYDEQGNEVDSCINQCLESYDLPALDFGKYTVSLTQSNACGDATVESKVEIRQLPDVNFSVLTGAYCYPSKINFLNTSGDEVTVFWWDFLGDSSKVIIDSQKVDHQWLYSEEGIYTVKLWGTDGYCRNLHDTTLDLTQRCKDIYVPNAFLPDSKNPELNVFKPRAQDLLDYRIDIYDMYGKHIWSSTELDEDGCPSEAWDGTCPGGTPCPPGTYIWVIKATLSYGDLGTMEWDGQVYNQKGKRSPAGTVVLIRTNTQ